MDKASMIPQVGDIIRWRRKNDDPKDFSYTLLLLRKHDRKTHIRYTTMRIKDGHIEEEAWIEQTNHSNGWWEILA